MATRYIWNGTEWIDQLPVGQKVGWSGAWVDLGVPPAPGDPTIVALGTPTEWQTDLGTYPSAVQLDSTHWLLVYSGSGADGYAVVQEITGAGVITTIGTPFEFDTIGITDARPVAAVGDTADVALVVYRSVDNDGFAQALNINPSTWEVTSGGAALEFEVAALLSPDIQHIVDDRFLVVYRGDANDGWAYVLDVTAGVVTSSASFEFDVSNGAGPSLAKIDDGHYIVSYGGPNDDGFIKVLAVDLSTWAITTEGTLEYDLVEGLQNCIAQLDANHFLNVWTNVTAGTSHAQVFEVNLSTWVITAVGTPTAISLASWTVTGERPQATVVMLEDTTDDVFFVVRARRDATPVIYLETLVVDGATWAVSELSGSEVSVFNGGLDPRVYRISDTRLVLWWHEVTTQDGYAQCFNYVR